MSGHTIAQCADPEPHEHHLWQPEPRALHGEKRCPGVRVVSTPSIEDVLHLHTQVRSAGGMVICACGRWMADMPGGSPGDDERHRAHLAQALAPVLAAAVREARAAELREVAKDPSLRLSGHSGISITRLLARADRITEPVSHEAATSGEEASNA